MLEKRFVPAKKENHCADNGRTSNEQRDRVHEEECGGGVEVLKIDSIGVSID